MAIKVLGRNAYAEQSYQAAYFGDFDMLADAILQVATSMTRKCDGSQPATDEATVSEMAALLSEDCSSAAGADDWVHMVLSAPNDTADYLPWQFADRPLILRPIEVRNLADVLATQRARR